MTARRLSLVWLACLGACSGDVASVTDAGALDATLDARDGATRDGATRDGTTGDGATRDGTMLDAAMLDGSFPLPTCALDAVFALGALDVSEPGSEGYEVPSAERLDALARSMDAALDGAWSDALEAAAEARYTVCADGEVRVWRPLDATGQARIAWRPAASRALILEVPHPFFDTGTLGQGLELFQRLDARVLIASGTHRCANLAPGCEGTSDACGEPAGYRQSDAAHFAVATFQRAHERLSERFTDDVVVSLHGFRQDGASVSDGTTHTTTEERASSRLARALASAGIEGVTSCNPGAGVELAERLCGTTNVQGRHLNGSPDVCDASAPGASGRFIHLEQSRTVRASIDLVAEAFAVTF